MGSIFFELTIIICLAAFLAIVFRFLKQPVILAYILTGIIIGPFGQFQLQNKESLHALAQLGVTLLLFMMGLELKFSELRQIGKSALIIGILQILFTSTVGYFICFLLGFSFITSFYISVALTFSSTIIIIKLLSDKKDLWSLWGKLSVGILLIQDFFAILILVFLSTFTKGVDQVFSFELLIPVVAKAVVLFACIIFLSKAVFPKLVDRLARSEETLFLFSLAWVFGLSFLVSSHYIGFTIEIGGFLAGLAFANTLENVQIVAKVRSLRDFFITIFFVTLGIQMGFSSFSAIVGLAVLFSLFVIIGKPLIVLSIMGLFGYRRRTSFLTAITTSQISEFSLVIIFLGAEIGHVSSEIVSLITLVALISFTFSAYLIHNSKKIYTLLNRFLTLFERGEKGQDTLLANGLKDHVVLVGAHRIGSSILNALKEEKEKVVVVDFNPDIVHAISGEDIIGLFGDIADVDVQERASLRNAKLIISTVPDLDDNLMLIHSLKRTKEKVKTIVFAQDSREAEELSKKGADYVIQPHLLSGKHVAKLIKNDTL